MGDESGEALFLPAEAATWETLSGTAINGWGAESRASLAGGSDDAEPGPSKKYPLLEDHLLTLQHPYRRQLL